MDVPTPSELRATLVLIVAGVTETPPDRWDKLVGQVEKLSLALHPRCNWRVEVRGDADQRRVLDAAIELLQREQPYVTEGKSLGAERRGLPAH